MFVAELDRPWLDTPFLIEGLLLEDQTELNTLRQYCRFVHVDPERSIGSVADQLRRAAPDAGTSSPSGHRPRMFSRGATPRDAGRHPGLAPLRRLPDWLHAQPERQGSRDKARVVADLQLPPGMQLNTYAPPAPIEAELPRAREAWSRGSGALRTLMHDLHDEADRDVHDIDQVADDLVESMIESPDAMLWVARMRNEHQGTYQHSLRVALYLEALGRQIGFPREDLVRLGLIGMLADVGKIRLPLALLEKPGMLTPPEHAVVRKHVQLGIDSLRKSMKLDSLVEQGILQHHERLDGSGYPRKLKGKEISIYGRMAGIADCFAALITDRPYAKAMAPHDALMSLYQWSGASFHEPLVEQLVQAIGIFPIGSLVELSNGEVAVVLAHNPVHRLEPRVLVLLGPDKMRLDPPIERDLLASLADGSGRALRIAHGLPAGAYGLEAGDYYASGGAHQDGLVGAVA